MNRFLLALAAVVAIGAHTAVAGTLVKVEEAAEMTRFQMRLDGSAAGRIYARLCDQCELLSLRADNKTLIRRGSSRLSLDQAADLKDKGATVLFNPTTLQVTRIIFWN